MLIVKPFLANTTKRTSLARPNKVVGIDSEKAIDSSMSVTFTLTITVPSFSFTMQPCYIGYILVHINNRDHIAFSVYSFFGIQNMLFTRWVYVGETHWMKKWHVTDMLRKLDILNRTTCTTYLPYNITQSQSKYILYTV